MTTISTRSGLEDRIISVVPVVQKLEAAPVAEYLEGEKDLTKGWLLKLEGGSYNGVKQSAEVEMKCDEGAKEVIRVVQYMDVKRLADDALHVQTVPTFNSYDPLKGVLSLKWTTAAACSTSSGSPPPKDDGGNKDEGDKPKEGEDKPAPSSGLGFFGWFFTLCASSSQLSSTAC